MARIHTAIRLSESSIARIDKIAAEHGLTRSEVMRACFVYALSNEAGVGKILTDLVARRDEP